MSKPVVFAVQPNRGTVLPQSAQAFYAQPTRGGLIVSARNHHASILEQCFNRLWCDALNDREQHRPRYFAMLHDDVCPDPYWLDTLIGELEKHDADVVSAVVPIKDQYGLTSTAVGFAGDLWSTKTRRLTMTEVAALPQTFGRSDLDWPQCGDALLVNSGCWVCRFDSPWVEKIVWRTESRNEILHYQWTTHTLPEDWIFSADCHELGLKVMATTAVKLWHGMERCHNRSAWGQWSRDELWAAHESDRLARSLFEYPGDVDGWLTPVEGLALARLAQGRRVLEVGSYCGKSTICMARTAERVTSVDPHDGRDTPAPRDTFAELLANIQKYGVADKVEVIRGTSDEATGEYDFAFIDGAHDYDSVMNDYRIASELLANGGAIAFHDYRDDGHHPGVRRAVDEIVADGAKLAARFGSVAIVHPAAQCVAT